MVRTLRAACPGPTSPAARAPSTSRIIAAERRQRGAAEQLQVGRAPERHVLAEDAVPDVVEREAGEREARADEDQHAAERRLEAAGERSAPRPRLLRGEEDRQQAGEEDPEQPGEDEVVRDVGERAGVAARRRGGTRCPSTCRTPRSAASPTARRAAAPPTAAGPRRARRRAPRRCSSLDAPAAVPEHEGEHRAGDDHRADRPADDLAQLTAAGGWRARPALREEHLTVSMRHETVLSAAYGR